ncbi:hypothetical protein GALMADRAFT_210484 [Galerina marginata CBS 339.88]|uniref:Uncharacterized protein n=1 Tax=Galerina marginata (strain CBS 339.88) TaxID=685588 RepID=A0A067T9E5_GALM3|nr:hypothetical protein GALMADRAFT_210484 [Galerina marginata CBS 339.88]
MVNIKIDDRDSSVAYSPSAAWLPTGDRGEWLTTSTSTSSGGAVASLTFTGSGVSIWGTIPNTTQGGHPQLSFAVDNQPVVIQNPSQLERNQYQDKFIQFDPLPTDVTHTLRITNLNADAFFILDYILVTPLTTPVSTIFQSSFSSSTLTASSSTLSSAFSTPSGEIAIQSAFPSSGFITVTASGTSPTQQAPVLDTSLPASQTFKSAPQTFTPAPSQRNTTKAPPIAVILGVGIGSVAFLLVVILLLLKRRSTKNSDSNAQNASFENSSFVQQRHPTQKRLADANVYYGEESSSYLPVALVTCMPFNVQLGNWKRVGSTIKYPNSAIDSRVDVEQIRRSK